MLEYEFIAKFTDTMPNYPEESQNNEAILGGQLTIDTLEIPFGWSRGEGDWTGVAAVIARGETVEVIQEVGSTIWQNSLPKSHLFYFGFKERENDLLDSKKMLNAEEREDSEDAEKKFSNSFIPKARIWISFTQRKFSLESNFPKVQWHPRVLWVGIGCQRETPRELIEIAIQKVCRTYHLAEGAIAGIATINTKANEIGIIELCQGRNWSLKTFSAEILRAVEVPNPSKKVAGEVGTFSVAEAAAICAANQEFLTPDKHRYTQIQEQHPPTSACIWGSNYPLLIPKQIVRPEGPGGAVTVAIAF